MKYAFKNCIDPNIHVTLNQQDANLHLVVKDNGIGLPEDFSIENSNSLGYRLIQAFSNKLKATLKMESDRNGTTISLKFPKKKVTLAA